VGTRGRGRPPAGDPGSLPTEELLDAALEAFATLGFEGTSVREVARSLGVSHNLIPQRIGSKEQLWQAAVDHGFTRLAFALAEIVTGPLPGDDLATLRALVVRFVEAMGSRPALLRIIAREAATGGPRFDYLFDTFIVPVLIFGGDLLARLRVAGRLRTDSVALMYFFMTHGAGGPLALPAMARRFGLDIDPEDPASVHRHAEAAADLLFDGLVAPVATPASTTS
jgi:AcrR family transcriptional regulator